MNAEKRSSPDEPSSDYIELSEQFEKSAEVINFEPSDEYEVPTSMALPTSTDDEE